jgi:thymidylate synthase (FAD)
MSSRESLKGVKFPVLDHGHVILLDFMGSDADIAEAARTSYQAGTKQTSDDETLLKYLMRHRHSTPFEMAEIKLHVRVPMDTWRQWVRHRTANINEYSTRYSEAIDDAATTDPEEWRLQATANKQGSSGKIEDLELGAKLSKRESEFLHHARDVYHERLAHGVAREQARKDLPLSTYTEAIWKIDLHNMFHFLGLRMEAHAQKEIRDYATLIGESIVSVLFPKSWKAFVDYRLNAMALHGREIEVISKMLASAAAAGGRPIVSDWMNFLPEDWLVKRCRERDEFFEKIERLGLGVWRHK